MFVNLPTYFLSFMNVEFIVCVSQFSEKCKPEWPSFVDIIRSRMLTFIQTNFQLPLAHQEVNVYVVNSVPASALCC